MDRRDEITERLPVPALCHHGPRFLCQCGHDNKRHAEEPVEHPRGRQVQAALDAVAVTMPHRSTQPHRGCQVFGGPRRLRCACAFSRQRVAEMFPNPAWLVGDSTWVHVTVARDGFGNRTTIYRSDLDGIIVSAYQDERHLVIPKCPPVAAPPHLTGIGGIGPHWAPIDENIAGPNGEKLAILVVGLDPGNASISVRHDRFIFEPRAQMVAIAEKMVRTNMLAEAYLERLCVGVDHELEHTLDENIAGNLGTWLRVFQDELTRRRAARPSEAS